MLGVLTLALLAASGLWLQAQTVDGFTLINADSDQPIAGFDPLTNNALINLATLPTRNLNIRANTTPSTDFGSVTFALTGATARNQTEGAPPWALAGDSSAITTPCSSTSAPTR